MRSRTKRENSEQAPPPPGADDRGGQFRDGAPSSIRYPFQVDLRALAAFRIAIAMILVWDLLTRARDLEAHYTDAGVIPRTVLIDSYLALHPYLSVHILNGTVLFEALLFCVAGLAAVSLLVGFRAQRAVVACWFLTCSLHARNPLVIHGGDDLLRMLLFWAMFVPLGGRWSVDHARASEIDSDRNFACSMGTAGLMLQLCFMYIFSGVLKSHPSWRSEGTAVYLALSMDQFATPIARALLPYHGLLTALTFSTLALEMGGPFLALFSFRSPMLRTLVVAGFIAFHIGLGLCLELGIFPAVCIAGWLVFLPAAVWDALERWLGPRQASWGRSIPAPVASLGIRMMEGVKRRPLRLRQPWETNLLCAFFLAYILLWNVRACNFNRFEPLFPRRLNGIGEVARIDQYWNLFAPYPSLEHGWYVLDAHLRDGAEIDLLTGRQVTWDKPSLVSAAYGNERWRKYLMNLWTGQYASYRPYYAQYLHRTWNDAHPAARQLARLEICFVLEKALPNYRLSPRERVRIWSQDWVQ